MRRSTRRAGSLPLLIAGSHPSLLAVLPLLIAGSLVTTIYVPSPWMGGQGYCGANSGRTKRFQLLPGGAVAARRCQLLCYLRWLQPRFLAQQHGR